MDTLFMICLVAGVAVLLLQVLLGLIGMHVQVPDALVPVDVGGSPLSAGAELLSVRSVAAAAAVFGATGLALEPRVSTPLAVALAIPAGFSAAVLNAFLNRLILRAQSDGSLRLDNAVGAAGTVYLPVPGKNQGAGLVQLTLQGRIVELRATTREASDLPTGASVFIVAVDPESETVEVVSTSSIEALS